MENIDVICKAMIKIMIMIRYDLWFLPNNINLSVQENYL